jgi:hypothetical protein
LPLSNACLTIHAPSPIFFQSFYSIEYTVYRTLQKILATVFITGSADGLGLMSARLLVADGHQVVLRARNPNRAKEATSLVSGAESAVLGDLPVIAETERHQMPASRKDIYRNALEYQESRFRKSLLTHIRLISRYT